MIQDLDGSYRLISGKIGEVGTYADVTVDQGFALVTESDGTFSLLHYDGTKVLSGITARYASLDATKDNRCAAVDTGSGNYITVSVSEVSAGAAAPEAGVTEVSAPADDGSWTCPACSAAGNTGKFCPNCGGPKPEPVAFQCTNCGYTPAEGETPKFCPECGTKMPER